jgi:TetR/AcrR family transcriptional repressor of mexJK operon
VSRTLADSDDLAADLGELANQFVATLMQPRVLRLRRLVIANADRFPETTRKWYEQGLERVLGTLSSRFQDLAGGDCCGWRIRSSPPTTSWDCCCGSR